jgi:hypothetical protein
MAARVSCVNGCLTKEHAELRAWQRQGGGKGVMMASFRVPPPRRISTSVTTSIAAWLGVVSTAVTVAFTALNAYWSREIQATESELKKTDQRLKERAVELDEQLKRREADLSDKKLEIDRLLASLAEGKERMARFAFVQGLLPAALGAKDASERTVTINLINLALPEQEAQKLFAGMTASTDKRSQDVGMQGQDLLALTSLVGQMNAAVRTSRVGAVESLVGSFRSSPEAIDLALTMLESPKIDGLSSDGRVNVLIFLTQTARSAWSDAHIGRARAAIDLMRKRDRDGVAALGGKTEDLLQSLAVHLMSMR